VTGPAFHPSLLNPAGVVTVDAHCVEHGDIIVGHPRRSVTTILYHGSEGGWHYYDQDGRLICRRPLGARTQVIRGAGVDDCNPHGIVRPLRLVAGGR